MCLSGEITPTEEAALLDTEAGEEVPVLCEHWLLDPQDGGLRPEDDMNCPKCSKTWKSLLLECLQQESPATSRLTAVQQGMVWVIIWCMGVARSAPIAIALYLSTWPAC